MSPPAAAAAAAQQLELVPLDGNAGAWDQLVREAGGNFCQLSGWRDIFSDVLGAQCLYWAAEDHHGMWQGILPLVRVRSRIFGHYLVSLPFLNAGGPLGSRAARHQLVRAALHEASGTGADLLELRTRDAGDFDLPLVSRKITVLLGLPPDADTLFKQFPSKLRSQIRRPMKDGLEVRFGLEQREPFYDVFARTMRDLGTPVLPRAFFERVAAAFPDLVVFGVVYRGDEPLAGGCGFVWRDEFEMTWAGARRESGRGSAANMLLYWAFMEHVIGCGARVFNFGRCTPGEGTHRFKQQWGGIDVPLPWYQHVSPTGQRRAMPSPRDPAFAWGPRLWRHLPLAIANRLGAQVVRFLP